MKNSDQNQENKIKPVETALQQNFKMVSLKEIGRDFAEVEQKRQGWLQAAIMFGIKTIYAKSQISRGELDDFLAKAIAADKKSIQTARRYVYLAGKVAEQILRPSVENEIGSRVIEFLTKNKLKSAVIFASQEKLSDILAFVLNGLSMRGLTKALHAIDAQLAIEEKIEAAGKTQVPTAVQMSFEDELFAPIGKIQKLIATDSFADLPKEKALQFANALIAEGQALKRKLTK